MKLTVKRTFKGDKYTIGKLYINGVYFCDTLEDKVRNLPTEAKIMHETAIPTGVYKVILNRSPRFGRILPRLVDVPYFEGVLIHSGNTDKDTSGCILVGKNTEKGKVTDSRHWERELVKRLDRAKDVTITIG